MSLAWIRIEGMEINEGYQAEYKRFRLFVGRAEDHLAARVYDLEKGAWAWEGNVGSIEEGKEAVVSVLLKHVGADAGEARSVRASLNWKHYGGGANRRSSSIQNRKRPSQNPKPPDER